MVLWKKVESKTPMGQEYTHTHRERERERKRERERERDEMRGHMQQTTTPEQLWTHWKVWQVSSCCHDNADVARRPHVR